MKDHHRREGLHHIVFLLLIFCAYGLLLWLSHLHPVHWQITPSGKHSLSEAGRALAEQLTGEVELIAFVRNEKDRKSVRRFIRQYQQHSPALKLTFIDPWTNPDEVNRYRPGALGEIIVLRDGRRLKLSPEQSRNNRAERLNYREDEFNRILSQLIRDEDFIIYFLAGHGERLPTEHTNRSVSLWGTLLKQNGYALENITPAQTDWRRDARLLIIASPQIPLTPEETGNILYFLEHGGNLLWLTDPGPSQGLENLAAALRLRLSEQSVLTTETLPGMPEPDLLLPDPLRYGDHPALAHFSLQTLFIKSRSIHPDNSPDRSSWRLTPLIQSDEHTTSQNGADDGPFHLAVALERPTGENSGSQRVVVVGDGDLLSNTYLENGGNAELGLRLIDWLAHHERNLAVPPSVAPDAVLNIPATMRSLQLFFFVGILPAGLMIGGFLLRRHRQRL